MSLCCPLCGSNKFDGSSCKECGYIISDVPSNAAYDSIHNDFKAYSKSSSKYYYSFASDSLAYFESPNLLSIRRLEAEKPPAFSGIYGWYFDELPPYVSKIDCTSVKSGRWPFKSEWWLLYIGKAKNLEERIVNYHINGNHYAEGTMSSLRLSLGCLLSDKLGLTLNYPPESYGKKEKVFNKWLEKHARIAWIRSTIIDEMEKQAIIKYTLPLNYEYNHHPLVQPLSNLRKALRQIVQDQYHKPKKKYFKKAYKTFVSECKSLGIKK